MASQAFILVGLLLLAVIVTAETQTSRLQLNTDITLTKPLDGQSLPEFNHQQQKHTPQQASAGRLFFTTIKQVNPLITDLTVQQYISSLGELLVNHAQIGHTEHTFFVVANPTINAFAGPADYIGIHSGLILQTDNEDQLASVVAHEIAHQKQRHLERLSKSLDDNPLSNPLLLTSIILAGIVSNNPEASAAGFMFALGGVIDETLAHSRSLELEADQIGLQIMQNSGFNPQAAIELLRKLEAKQQNASIYLSSHPPSEQRINELQNRLKGPPQRHLNSIAFQLIQARLMVLSDPLIDPDNAASPLQVDYMRLMQSLQAHDYAQFERLWQKYQQTQIPHLLLLLGKRQLADDQWANLDQTLNTLEYLIPDHLALTELKFKSHLKQGRMQTALKLLQQQRQRHPKLHQAHLWAMQEQLHQHQNQPILALQARARESFQQGYVRHSLSTLKQAIELAEKQHRQQLTNHLKSLYRHYHYELHSRSTSAPESPY